MPHLWDLWDEFIEPYYSKNVARRYVNMFNNFTLLSISKQNLAICVLDI